MSVLLKKLSGVVSDGMLLSGRPELSELDLDRDFPDVERLFELEQWPFLRSDLEVSHRQPLATAFVARKNGRFAGFFAAHHFGDVGYLDMMILDPAFRRSGIARPLYFRTVNELRRKGIRSFVLHTTNDSARIIRLIGFRPGQSFTLLRREPSTDAAGLEPEHDEAITLDRDDRAEILGLDEDIFGMRRESWIDALLDEPDTRFVGLHRGGRLVASLCLRPRRDGAYAIDAVNGRDDESISTLVRGAVSRRRDRRLECFVRDGSGLETTLSKLGFAVPDFFVDIGPLVEWRKGRTGGVGSSPRIQCLSWF